MRKKRARLEKHFEIQPDSKESEKEARKRKRWGSDLQQFCKIRFNFGTWKNL